MKLPADNPLHNILHEPNARNPGPVDRLVCRRKTTLVKLRCIVELQKLGQTPHRPRLIQAGSDLSRKSEPATTIRKVR